MTAPEHFSRAPVSVVDEGEEESHAQDPVFAFRWKLLVVDDEPAVHEATTLALKGTPVLGRPVELLSAYSAAQAEAVLAAHPDVAIVMLDVVMEQPHAGLELVRAIRERLGMRQVRLILRTGQPGLVPQLQVLQDYDINDYRTKSDLTRTSLLTSITAALRSYEQIGELQRAEALLRRYAVHRESVRETEMRRIATEVHDIIGQYLTGARMQLALLDLRQRTGAVDLEHEIAAIKNTLDEAIAATRDICASMRPAVIDLGIAAAAEWLVEATARFAPTQFQLTLPAGAVVLPEDRAIAAFRILQEAVRNVVRHAQARLARIDIAEDDGTVRIEVCDNGIGFDAGAARHRESFGVLGMHERARAAGATLRIDSAPGQGTRVCLVLPVRATTPTPEPTPD